MAVYIRGTYVEHRKGKGEERRSLRLDPDLSRIPQSRTESNLLSPLWHLFPYSSPFSFFLFFFLSSTFLFPFVSSSSAKDTHNRFCRSARATQDQHHRPESSGNESCVVDINFFRPFLPSFLPKSKKTSYLESVIDPSITRRDCSLERLNSKWMTRRGRRGRGRKRRRNNGKESGIDFFAWWMKITQGKEIFGSVCQMYAALCLCVSR